MKKNGLVSQRFKSGYLKFNSELCEKF